MMCGPKIGNVFKSRWQALWWSAGILMLAYCTVPSEKQTEQAQKQKELEQQQREAASRHVNPWAKDAPTQQ